VEPRKNDETRIPNPHPVEASLVFFVFGLLSSFVICHSSLDCHMTLWTLVLRSLRFHARAHLGALLGATVGSAVLIGALVVGDSVRGSLREMALARLGKVQIALAANDRFFR